MASKRQAYSWKEVTAGDIISFRYKSTKVNRFQIHTILVLNPRYYKTTSTGSNKRALVGIKLKTNNKFTEEFGLRLNNETIRFFEKIGDFKKTDEKNGIWKLQVKDQFVLNEILGTKPRAYKFLSVNETIADKYRTYDYIKARKSTVYLEPVILFGKQ
tara:strand:+ start:805 stop:1278 length:474 start_codon:yes stop_codon:yes gene_type:complete